MEPQTMSRQKFDRGAAVARYFVLRNMTAVAREMGCSREVVKLWLEERGIKPEFPKGRHHTAAKRNIDAIVGPTYGDLTVIAIEKLNEHFVGRSTVLCRCIRCSKTVFYSLQRLQTRKDQIQCGWCHYGRVRRPGPGEELPPKSRRPRAAKPAQKSEPASAQEPVLEDQQKAAVEWLKKAFAEIPGGFANGRLPTMNELLKKKTTSRD
jgi:hypothetical protein